jgi:ABC-type molybdate transport system permease subunit
MLYCGWTYLPLVAKPTVVGYKLNIILIYGILSGMLYIRVYIYMHIQLCTMYYGILVSYK